MDFRKKEISYERILFFSDAIVAIAITLLALGLKIGIPDTQKLQFSDIIKPWHQYLAFLLSFVNIAGFWRMHHRFFTYIQKFDEMMSSLHFVWLFFIILLPFSTSLLSSHFGETPAIVLYSANILMISVMQNFIWDYADGKEEFVNSEMISVENQSKMRWMFNFDMLNGLVAVVVGFFAPVLAFFLLFFKIPIFIAGIFIIGRERSKEIKNLKNKQK